MTIRAAYDAWAATYDADRNLTRDLDAAVTRRLLADVRAERVLEIGCGTGKNTPFLAEIAGRVLALDFSPGMLAVARSRLRAAGVNNADFALADLTHPWPCAADRAHLVTANLVLEHVADLASIYAQARRVLRPGGLLFLCELHPDRQDLGKRATFQQDQARIEIPAFTHRLSDYAAAAARHGFALRASANWRHEADTGKPPRLVSFIFEAVEG